MFSHSVFTFSLPTKITFKKLLSNVFSAKQHKSKLILKIFFHNINNVFIAEQKVASSYNMGERGKEVFSEEKGIEVEAVRLGLIVPENLMS